MVKMLTGSKKGCEYFKWLGTSSPTGELYNEIVIWCTLSGDTS